MEGQNEDQISQPSVINQPTSSTVPIAESPLAGQPSPTASQPVRKRHTGKIIALVLILVTLVMLALGTVGVFAYLQLQKNKPDAVLADAVANTAADFLEQRKIESLSTIKIVSDKAGEEMTAEITIDAQLSREDGEVTASVKFTNGDIPDLRASATVLYLNSKEAYIRINNLQQSIDAYLDSMIAKNDYTAEQKAQFRQYFTTILGDIVAKVDGKYIKITADDLSKYGGQTDVNKCRQALTDLLISDDDRAEMKNLFKRYPFIKVRQSMESEMVKGTESYHYIIDLNSAQTKAFFNAASNLDSYKQVKTDCKFDPDNAAKKFGTDDKKPQESVIELWVDKKARRLNRVRTHIHDKNTTVDFSNTSVLNANVSVQAPTEFLTMDELKQDIEALGKRFSDSD